MPPARSWSCPCPRNPESRGNRETLRPPAPESVLGTLEVVLTAANLQQVGARADAHEVAVLYDWDVLDHLVDHDLKHDTCPFIGPYGQDVGARMLQHRLAVVASIPE